MKIAVIIVRVVFGLMFVMPGIMMVTGKMPQPKLEGAAKLFTDGMMATGYLFPLLMGTEFVCGLLCIIGRFVALAAVMIFPVTLNIFFYHIFVDPKGLPIAIFMMAANLFLAYANWDKYKPMLAAK